MNFLRQTKVYCLAVLWVSILFFVVACGSSARSERMISEVTPIPSDAAPVDYGASLSEWEEATQADAEQTAGGAGTDGAAADAESASGVGIPFTLDDVVYREITWDNLMPADFTADALMAKYEDQLAEIEDGSPEAVELYSKMQEEFNNAPVNEVIDETLVRLPGFIAPLNYTGELITEFLLVPYFGACIHVPPPPVNQTVLVKTVEGEGIKAEDSYSPIWVMGRLTTEASTTQLASAGYHIQEAIIEPYVALK